MSGMDATKSDAFTGKYFIAFMFIAVFNLRCQCDPRVRRWIPKGGRRQPLFGCHRQRDITSNEVFKCQNPHNTFKLIRVHNRAYTLKAALFAFCVSKLNAL